MLKLSPIYMILLLVSSIFLGGCASTFQGVPVLESELGQQVVVRALVGRVLTEKPTWVEPTYTIMTEAIDLVDEDTATTLDNLTKYIIGKIPMKDLTFEEQDLVMVLITEISNELRKNFEERGIANADEQLLAVRKVLVWIQQTAEIRRTL